MDTAWNHKGAAFRSGFPTAEVARRQLQFSLALAVLIFGVSLVMVGASRVEPSSPAAGATMVQQPQFVR